MKKPSTTVVILSLALSACAEEPIYVTPAYAPPVAPYAVAAPMSRPLPRFVPPAAETPSSDPTPPVPAVSDRPTADAVPTTGDDVRFRHLKDVLEREGQSSIPATQVAAVPDKAVAGNCSRIQIRNGFHDHYGALNSAGDVPRSCGP